MIMLWSIGMGDFSLTGVYIVGIVMQLGSESKGIVAKS